MEIIESIDLAISKVVGDNQRIKYDRDFFSIIHFYAVQKDGKTLSYFSIDKNVIISLQKEAVELLQWFMDRVNLLDEKFHTYVKLK